MPFNLLTLLILSSVGFSCDIPAPTKKVKNKYQGVAVMFVNLDQNFRANCLLFLVLLSTFLLFLFACQKGHKGECEVHHCLVNSCPLCLQTQFTN